LFLRHTVVPQQQFLLCLKIEFSLVFLFLAAVPGSPTILGIHDKLSTSCTVIYLPPDNDGGSPVTGYILEHRSPGSDWIRLTDTPVTGFKLTIHDVVSLIKYEFRVAAVNVFGIGSFSETSEVTLSVPSVPHQPRWPVVVRLVGTSVSLEWTAPATDHEISTYLIRYGVPGSDYSVAHFDGQTTECTLTWLKPRTKYHFAVAAVNKDGCGPFSKFSEYVITHRHGK